MRASDLKRKYRRYWDLIENEVIDDMRQCMPGYMVEVFETGNPRYCRIRRVAHNAAFIAISEYHKIVKKMYDETKRIMTV